MSDSTYRFPFKVVDMRAGGGNALAFFTVQVGIEGKAGYVPVFVIKDFVLKRKRDGGLFFVPPSKLRVRNGEPVLDGAGFKVYDPIADLYGEKGAGQGGPDKWSPTKAAFALRKQILGDAEEQLKGLAAENSGRGSAAPAGVTETVAVAVGGDGGDEGDLNPLFGADDDMPF